MYKDIDKYWDKYKEIYSFEIILREYRERKALELIKLKKPKNILEIGCGYNPLFLKYKKFETYTIVEPSKKAYDFILKNIKEKNNINLFNTHLEDCSKDIQNISFDYIICNGVLHETHTPEIFLKRISDLMNKNTQVYVNVPNANSMHRLIAQAMGIIENVYEKSERNISLQINKNYDKLMLQKLINENISNIKIMLCETFFIKPFTHDQMMKCLDNQILNPEIIEGLYKISDNFSEFGCEIYCLFKKR